MKIITEFQPIIIRIESYDELTKLKDLLNLEKHQVTQRPGDTPIDFEWAEDMWAEINTFIFQNEGE